MIGIVGMVLLGLVIVVKVVSFSLPAHKVGRESRSFCQLMRGIAQVTPITATARSDVGSLGLHDNIGLAAALIAGLGVDIAPTTIRAQLTVLDRYLEARIPQRPLFGGGDPGPGPTVSLASARRAAIAVQHYAETCHQ